MKILTKGLVVLFLAIIMTACGNTSANISDAALADALPLERLKAGNARFKANKPMHPDQNLERLQALENGQNPFAVIVGCSDSRVPPSLIFDQGLGDLFIIRNAGNLVSNFELGSVEYAVEHLNTSLVVVLGHKKCGAVHAFVEHKHDTIHSHIQSIIDYIKAEKEELALSEKDPDYENLAIMANIRHGLNELRNSEPVLAKMVKEGKVQIVGALYDLETGEVEFLKD